MKIIQIIPEFGFGGAETMCENLSIELSRQGQDVCVVSLYSTKNALTQRLEKEVPIIYLNKKRGLDFSIFLKLIKLIKREKPDIVHTHLYALKYAVPACIIARVKGRIHTVHNVAQKEATKKNRIVNKIIYHRFNVIPVALSNEIKNTIVDTYNIPSETIPVIFNGIDLTKCIKKESYEIKNNKVSILHIGRFSDQKNHIGLVTAFNKVHTYNPNCELSLIGDGDLFDQVKKRVSDMRLCNSVCFLGVQHNVYPYLNQADIFILPSKYEGVPMTLIEAMGTGLPIIATGVGGVPDMLEDGKEAILINNTEDEICDSLVRLLNDSELRERIGKNAALRATKFSITNTANEYIKVYLDTCKGSTHGS